MTAVALATASLTYTENDAHAGVNPNGSFTHSTTIDVPEVGPGPHPKLALSYDSQARNGFVGAGWRLDGLGVVTRIAYSSSVDYTASDTFAGPSGRLIRMSDGSFHGENEDWVKYTPVGTCGSGPCTWEARDREGNLLVYGSLGGNGTTWHGLAGIRAWALTRVQDLHGNAWTVTYTNHGNQMYPLSIATATHHVDLAWVARPDPLLEGEHGTVVATGFRLGGLTVFAGGSAPTDVVRSYELAYQQNPDSQASQLVSIVRKDAAGVWRDAQTFEWNAGAPFGNTKTYYPSAEIGEKMLTDVNGDGLDDLVQFYHDWANKTCRIEVWPATHADSKLGVLASASVVTTAPCDADVLSRGDFDGTGRSDFLFAKLQDGETTAHQVVGWFGRRDFKFDVRTVSLGAYVDLSTAEIFTGDFDGNGITDLATHQPGASALTVLLAEPALGFVASAWSVGTTWGTGARTVVGDFDGDGRTDLASVISVPDPDPPCTNCPPIPQVASSFHLELVIARSTGSAFEVRRAPGPDHWATAHAGDFNGDGRTDLLVTGSVTSSDATLLLSTGRAFQLVSVGLVGPSTSQQGVWTLGDFNGDGRTDIFRTRRSLGPNVGEVLVFDGSGFDGTLDYDAVDLYTGGSPAGAIVGDINGDGIADTLSRTSSGETWIRTRRARLDLMTAVHSGFPNTWPPIPLYAISYEPAPQMNGAVLLSDDCEGGTGALACGRPDSSPSHLARALTVAGTYVTDYEYFNGRYYPGSPTVRMHLGFQAITAKDRSANIWTQSQMWQTRPLSGLIRWSGAFLVSNGGGDDDSVIPVERTDNLDWQQYVCSDLGCTVANGVVLDQPRQFRSLNQSQRHYEHGRLLSEDSTQVRFDPFLNQRSVVTFTTSGGLAVALRRVEGTFINKPTGPTHVIGLPLQSKTMSYATPSPQAVERDVTIEEDFYDGLPYGQVGALAEPRRATIRRGTAGALEEITRTFDARGNILSERSPNGLTTTHEYLNGTTLAATTDVNGRVEFQTDRKSGLVISTKWPDGVVRTSTVDALMRISATETRAPDQRVLRRTTSTGDSIGSQKTDCAFDPTSTAYSCTTSYFDQLHREFQTSVETAPNTVVVTLQEWGVNGKLARRSNPFLVQGEGTPSDLGWTTFEYDDVGRTSAIVTPDGSRTTTTYNQGALVPGAVAKRTITSPRGGITVEFLGPDSKPVRMIEGRTCVTCDDGLVTSYEYDGDRQLVAIVRPNGSRTTMAYNARGQRTQLVDPNLGTIATDYVETAGIASFAKVRTETRPSAVGGVDVETYVYDGTGRLLTRGVAGKWLATFVHDDTPAGMRRLVETRLSEGGITVTKRSSFDLLGQESTVRQLVAGNLPDGTSVTADDTITITRDYLGRETGVTYPGNVSGTKTYDARGLASASVGTASVAFTDLDARGHWTKATAGNGVVTTRTFDPAAGRILSQRVVRGSTVLDDRRWTWDADGNVASQVDVANPSLTTTYGYDAMDRLVRADRGSDAFRYAFDAGGNLVTKSDFLPNGSVVQRTRTVVAGTNRLANDGAGTAFDYAAGGQMITRGTTSYAWGAGDLLTAVRVDGEIVEATGFDALHQRAAHIERLADGALLTITLGSYAKRTRFKNGSSFAAQEVYALSEGVNTIATLTTGDVDLEAPSSSGPATKYLHGDHLGSSTVTTDGAGALVSRVVYGPYGEVDPIRSTLAGERRLFTGAERDGVSELSAMGVRMYDASLGGFISADTAIGNPHTSLDMLAYSYGRGNPLRYADPTGHFVWAPVLIGAAIGAVIGGTRGGILYDSAWWDGEYLAENWSWKRAVIGAAVGAALGAAWSAAPALPGKIGGIELGTIVREGIRGGTMEVLGGLAEDQTSTAEMSARFGLGFLGGITQSSQYFGFATGANRKAQLLILSRAFYSFAYSALDRAIDSDAPIEIDLPLVTLRRQGTRWQHSLQFITLSRYLRLDDPSGLRESADADIGIYGRALYRVSKGWHTSPELRGAGAGLWFAASFALGDWSTPIDRGYVTTIALSVLAMPWLGSEFDGSNGRIDLWGLSQCTDTHSRSYCIDHGELNP